MRTIVLKRLTSARLVRAGAGPASLLPQHFFSPQIDDAQVGARRGCKKMLGGPIRKSPATFAQVHSQRGSQLIELVLMLPVVLWAFTAVWWLALIGMQASVGLYTRWMAARTAALAWSEPVRVAQLQMSAIDPRLTFDDASVRVGLRHVRDGDLFVQPIAQAVDGDNPLALSDTPEGAW